MGVIRVERLATVDAEHFIVFLWRVLEEHGMPSPKISVYEAGELLDLRIEFPSEADSDVVRRSLPLLAAEPPVTAPRPICSTQPLAAFAD
jgi:hypothetical protein